MCGIVGMIGNRPAAPLLIDGLRRLEYRGYDSAGIATLEDGAISRIRAKGKLVNLEELVDDQNPSGFIGIGHTRWATHGAPSENNAHPHWVDGVAVVHNGIIENFQALRSQLEANGRVFSTDTDTEVAAHLAASYIEAGDDAQTAVSKCLPQLVGAFALAFLFKNNDDLIIVARQGAPLAIGHGAGEVFVGSDAIAVAPVTDKITYLEDGDWAVLTRSNVDIYDATGRQIDRPVSQSVASSFMVDKGNYRHFMIKEIYEQPEVTSHTLAAYLDLAEIRVGGAIEVPDFSNIDRLVITACGTAYYAGLVAKYWFERYAQMPVEIDIASELRYRDMPLTSNGMVMVISQSGETADTLACLRHFKDRGQSVASVVNVKESTIARASDYVCPIMAGPEIGVASTKAFTCQLTALAALAVCAGRQRGILNDEAEHQLVQAMIELPRLMLAALKVEPQIEALSRKLAKASNILYLGRGTSFPIALEGALKLKEISYIHAEAYAAGELKHGPIALIDENMPVVVIAPDDAVFEKTVSNMHEVIARDGQVMLITDESGAAKIADKAAEIIVLPDMPDFLRPIAFSIPVQMLAYHTAVVMGTDVDQPRNLAKSVTVE